MIVISKFPGRRLFPILALVSLASSPLFAAPGLIHRYSFASNAQDSVGSAHGTLAGGATIRDGTVVLDGLGAYVDLPNDLVLALDSLTLEVWLTDNNSGSWSRIFDFGNSTAGEGQSGSGTQYLFLSPRSGYGTLRGAITVSGPGGGEQLLEWPSTPLPAGSLTHVVWTTDAATQTGRLYVEGNLADENASMTVRPSDMGSTVNNWIGRSQFGADAFLNASITEFRIYDGALTAEEVLDNTLHGPDTVVLDGPVAFLAEPRSQTVTELEPAVFQVAYRGTPPVGVQWYRGATPLSKATNDSYTLPAAALSDDNATFRAELSNTHAGTPYTVISADAVLSVVPDLTPPVLVRASSLYPQGVLVEFSEPVAVEGATDETNYAITHSLGSLQVTASAFTGGSSTLLLTTAPQSLGTTYTLAVSNLRDRSAAANRIPPQSQTTFIASPYVTDDIGSPAVSGALTPMEGGYAVTAGGSGIGGTGDQFTFSHRSVAGDFDVQIRVGSLGFADTWTRAGLMARATLELDAGFAASFATPGSAGCYFGSRATDGAVAAMAGFFPANGRDTWLRLRRAGDRFEGLASLDGRTWQSLGSANLSLPITVEVGLALTAGTASGTTTASFHDESPGSGPVLSSISLPSEPLGPSSRRTPLVFSEILYNAPSAWGGTNSLEFVELWNSGMITENLTGHRLSGEISYEFPDGTEVAPGQFLLVAKDPAAAQAFYGLPFLGPFTNKLANRGGNLRLVNELGGRLLEVAYDNQSPWPVAADGTGHSLVLSHPSYGEADPRAWSASDRIGGSPGSAESYLPEPARGIVINEFLAHTDDPELDSVELFNPGAQSVDLSGAWLSDEAGTNKFRIQDGTTIEARGFLSYDQSQLRFSLAADGERIFLVNSNQTRVLDAVGFRGQANGIASGRHPDGAPGFQPLSALTPAAPNAPPLQPPVVLNEIMYHPISESNADEYLELYNRGPDPVDLSAWRLQGGISFTFPSNTVLAAQAYLVVAENLTNLIARYPQLHPSNTLGNYSGSLSDRGERLTLSMPEDLVSTNALGITVTNLFFIPVDEVVYQDGGRWGRWSDGGGSSLELRDPNADNRLPANWADSDESAKAPWTTLNVTEVLENGQNAATVDEGSGSQGVANRLELFLHGDGEALVDNVSFTSNNGGANLVSNGDFSGGTDGWTLGGVLRDSFTENGVGIGNSSALHLVSTDRGDTGPNKVSHTLSATAATGPPNTGTLRASLRWLKGSPDALLRIRGNWMEVSQRLSLPSTCGTPGQPNSRLLTPVGPAMVEVAHAPVLPADQEPVVVRARVTDPDGISAVALRYRVDPAVNTLSVAMNDDGVNGDAVAGDGLYSGTLPAQPANTLVAFSVEASDAGAAVSLFPAAFPDRECLVRWGETPVPGTLGTYRLWVTAANVAFWANRERNANDPIDATFVYGNSRVIYNVDTLYSGSPFHTPIYNGPLGVSCDYEVNFPTDDRFLGSEPFVLTAYDVVDNNFFFNDDSGQVDLTGTWIGRQLGQPYNYRRHVHVFMNGRRRGTIYDDAQQPNREMLEEYFPNDSKGQLRKIESWFEFADDAQSQGSTYATLEQFDKSIGGIDAKRYRWNWRPRATRLPDEWFALTNLIAAVNDTTASDYENRVRTWMDVRNFLRPIVTHHVCGSWDSYAYSRGKNMYAYKPDDQPWRLLMWDIELALGAGSDGPMQNINTMFDRVLYTMITRVPAFHREYLQGFQEAVDTALAPGVADRLLDERYACFRENNVPMASPQFIKNYLSARRDYLVSVLPSAPFSIDAPGTPTLATNSIRLTGHAPLTVDGILVNGVDCPITWSDVTAWTAIVALSPGVNTLLFQGLDRTGQPVAGATDSVTVNYTGASFGPENSVVFNEIGYAPVLSGAGFVELYNHHPVAAFDLSRWRINGLDYTFPPGTTLVPGQVLALVEDPFLFSTLHPHAPIFDAFKGALDPDGETLTLLRPGPTPEEEIVVDRVRYEPGRPWPDAANGTSLQLIDAGQDNSRSANWAAITNELAEPQPEWVFVSATGVPRAADASRPLYIYLRSTGDIYIDDLSVVAGTLPGVGANVVPNGEFEGTLSPWTIGSDGNNSASALNTSIRHSGNSSLHLVASSGGTSRSSSIWQDFSASLTVGATYTLGFWYRQSDNGGPLTVRFSFSGIEITVDPGLPSSAGSLRATPGANNAGTSNLPAFPPVWLNEVQPENLTGPTDNAGEREPWLELHNADATPFALDGYSLTDTYSDLTPWTFPPTSSIPAHGFLIVWCDGQISQSTPGAPHTSFRLAPDTGSVALTRLTNASPQLIDYLNYRQVPANWSYGDVPDGQPFYRSLLFFVTPGVDNHGASPPLAVFLNEWMADNDGTVADPADGNFEDWFEIFNPGPTPLDLGGAYLTDNLTNPFGFQIPNNGHYTVPPGGYLLVWADGEPAQNTTNQLDLHVDFSLNKDGEAIGLFAADGTTIDAITFAAQVPNMSEGRFPNGAPGAFPMVTPTPRTANVLANTPPALEPIADQWLTLGQTLNLNARAVDPDSPPQTLTFTLSSAPPEVSLHPQTGLLTWTPTLAPSTQVIGVVVTDDGAPNLSTTRTFTVQVELPPSLGNPVLQDDQFLFSCPTLPSLRYQVYTTDTLVEAVWYPVGDSWEGTGEPLVLMIPVDASAHRFYQIRVLP